MLTTPYEENKETDIEWENVGHLINVGALRHGWEMMIISFAIGKLKKSKIFMKP